MQQTDKYKLNLIESSDPFLPDALNENTRKLEQAVSEHLEGMDQRVQFLEACHIYAGSHRNTSSSMDFISLPFTPYAIMIFFEGKSFLTVSGPDGIENSNLLIAESGFRVHTVLTRSALYTFIAFG